MVNINVVGDDIIQAHYEYVLHKDYEYYNQVNFYKQIILHLSIISIT